MLNDKNMYLARFFIGSNKDLVKLSIDTGSSDFWVMDSDVICLPHTPRRAQYEIWTSCSCDDLAAPTEMIESTCISSGALRVNKSTTFEKLKDKYSDTHLVGGKVATGNLGRDDVWFANESLQMPFGVINVTNKDEGVLGLGFPASTSKNLSFPYELKKKGLIDRAMYSLYFNSTKSKIGSLLFGGIDHAKYHSALKTLPAVRKNNSANVAVGVDEISMIMNGTKGVVIGDTKTTYMLDTSSPISRFPLRVVDILTGALGGRIYKETNELIVDQCPEFLEFDINFDGKIITIPGTAFMSKSIGEHCLIRLQVDDTTPAFGQDFLRFMYVVVDLEEEQVSVDNWKFTPDYGIELLPSVGVNRSHKVEYEGMEKVESYGNLHSVPTEFMIAVLMWVVILVIS
ncbi:Candidapepsin-10 [Spathaspora sp. JA1]|nr:Candidapepsin-10 [Spathaspora sp. JA1]